MPNLNEIATFREELKNIAQERRITAQWGERVYDELPPPDPAEVPDVDLNALLPATEFDEPAGKDTPASESAHTDTPLTADNRNTASPVSSTDMFDTVPVTDASSIPADTSFSSEPDHADADDTVTDDAYPVGDESEVSGMPEFDDFLSSLNLDNPPEAENESPAPLETEALDTIDADTDFVDPSAFDTDAAPAGDFLESPIPADDEGGAAGDMPPESAELHDESSTAGADEPFQFDDMLSSFDFTAEPEAEPHTDSTDGIEPPADDAAMSSEYADAEPVEDEAVPVEERTIPDIDVPDIDLSAFDSLPDSSDDSAYSDDSIDADGHESFGDSQKTEGLDSASESQASDAPAISDKTADSSDVKSSGEDEMSGAIGGLGDLAELSLFSEDRNAFDNTDAAEESVASDGADTTDTGSFDSGMESSSFENTDSPTSESAETGFGGIGMPGHITDDFFTQQTGIDSGDQSGFSLEESPLDSDINEITDDQFNLPDNFKDFSADTHSRMFDSVIAKSTSSLSGGDVLSISDDDYFAFLNLLETFPFNVQLAIQDYIANGDDSPENKMSFIRSVLAKEPLKKVVNKLEKILNRTIPIPRGFQRRSVEEYEREKKTLKYWLLHRFLPVAVMSTIALLLAFCISVLSWQFIYKPVTAESLYKTGYTYLENGQYETAIEKFNKAGEYKRKKKWYFSYARAFRKQKQFTAAEKMYVRLIYDFNYDKQASLEYVDMLSTDLRNYEKAETVLRRRLLDRHVNDKDGLLALGDVFMNWADEEPEKYDAAVKVYSRLIELYGENDIFLLRMMRYFIRTDNLAEVLNLKDHFSDRLAKINAEDLTELSGYLLEKRYNPKPLDSETLRTKIDDVRMLLESAVQADKTVPEAYYNLGRFFIYNNKQDGAIENLTEAIKRFENAVPMTARRTVRYVDAMRLLGEQLVTQKKYFDAQTLYADALNIYREYTAFKPLPPNKDIGKLYADYGDIDYFISYNFDSALDNYRHAVKELYNTPSINYRIGYIQYRQENYREAIEAMSLAYAEKTNDKNLLYGFGNAFFKRGDYFASLAAYEQLLDLLNMQRSRKDHVFFSTRPDDAAFIEQYMRTVNNLGATLNRLAERTGDSQKNGRALALYAEATRAWDVLTRNPQTMIRAKSVGLAYLNIKNMLNSKNTYHAEIYTDIPMTLENERALEQKEDK